MQARRFQCSEPSRTGSLLLWCPLLPSVYRSCSLPPSIFPVTASIPVPNDRSAGPAVRTYFTRSTPTSGQVHADYAAAGCPSRVCICSRPSTRELSRSRPPATDVFGTLSVRRPGSGIDDGAERIPDPATPTSQQARTVWSGWVIASPQDDAISGCPAAAAMV
jgi:hypothetical protein